MNQVTSEFIGKLVWLHRKFIISFPPLCLQDFLYPIYLVKMITKFVFILIISFAILVFDIPKLYPLFSTNFTSKFPFH